MTEQGRKTKYLYDKAKRAKWQENYWDKKGMVLFETGSVRVGSVDIHIDLPTEKKQEPQREQQERQNKQLAAILAELTRLTDEVAKLIKQSE